MKNAFRNKPLYNCNLRFAVKCSLAGGKLANYCNNPPLRGIAVAVASRDSLASLDEEEKYLFEERAAIRELDGGFHRAEAERLAFAEVLGAREVRP